MRQDVPTPVAIDERAELERVAGALAKWPRLSGLLRYMGEKLSAGEVDQLTEYNIATEVLGRSKAVFNAADDAIARAETHRLRKRLASFYETDGRDHPIQVTLPPGSYVPVFVRKSAEIVSPAEPAIETPAPGKRVVPRWAYWAVAATVVATALGAYRYFRPEPSDGGEQAAVTPPAIAVAPVTAVEARSGPIRLMAGYSGTPRTDSAGRVWDPDRHFAGGGPWRRNTGFIYRTSKPFLFEHSRTGDFAYNIPLKPGSYELHLLFATPVRSIDGTSAFTIWINGQPMLEGFDINVDALGENIADERVFRDISPDKDGLLRINASGAGGSPLLNAIEILPSSPHKQLPIRLIMQTTPFTDRRAQFWRPDDYFMHGRLSGPTRPLLDSQEPDLFAGERFGHFSYALPVDTRGTYTLILHFAEFYFGAGSANGGPGSRVFKVMCNGATLLDNFDILKESPALHELTKTFRHLKPSAQGKLNVTFEPIVNNATISGIEVIDESQ